MSDEQSYFEQFRGDDVVFDDPRGELSLGAHCLISWIFNRMPTAKVVDMYTHWLTPNMINIVFDLPDDEYSLILHLRRWDKTKPMLYWLPSVIFFSEYCTQYVSGNAPIPDWAAWLVTASRQ